MFVLLYRGSTCIYEKDWDQVKISTLCDCKFSQTFWKGVWVILEMESLKLVFWRKNDTFSPLLHSLTCFGFFCDKTVS